MATGIKKAEGKTFELPKPGSYVARCIGLIILGKTDVTYKGVTEKKSLIRLRYELPTKLEQFKEEGEKQPWTVEIEFSNTTATKSNLFKWLTNWSPKITAANIEQFDLVQVLGRPCLLTLAHTQSKTDSTKFYLKATGITSLPEGMTIPDQINETFLFDVEEFDQDLFNTLPKFIREKILKSEEFKALKLNADEVESIAASSRGENVSEQQEEEEESEKHPEPAKQESKKTGKPQPKKEDFF